ncbi:MAG TPA: ADP-ribosylglycohydrolase family protein [Clostridia bacterium]|nr:ADP-ribosylglycohydrolase family protein [Clostridia bacterium]
MLGAIIGDIVGSKYEYSNFKSKDFKWFDEGTRFTDDTIMTVAIAKAFLDSKLDFSDLSEKAIYWMQYFGRKYPSDYGLDFIGWLQENNPKPYNSYGNGAAMRVSPAGWFANSIEQAVNLAKKVTEVSHNHPEGIRGAVAVSTIIYLCRKGASKAEIKDFVTKKIKYNVDFTLDQIRSKYKFDESCQGTVPVAIVAFLESTSFIDCIQNAISVGGDADTLTAIAGSIAEAYYVFPGIDEKIIKKAESYLPKELLDIINEFNKTDRINRSFLI